MTTTTQFSVRGISDYTQRSSDAATVGTGKAKLSRRQLCSQACTLAAIMIAAEFCVYARLTRATCNRRVCRGAAGESQSSQFLCLSIKAIWRSFWCHRACAAPCCGCSLGRICHGTNGSEGTHSHVAACCTRLKQTAAAQRRSNQSVSC